MKEKELLKSLNNLNSVYLIGGDDRFLCFRALETLKHFLCPNFPDLNIVYIEGDCLDFDKLIDDLQVCPFGDNYRLIIVKNFKFKKTSSKAQSEFIEKLSNYCKEKNFTTVLTFFNFENMGLKIKGSQEIDCSHLSEFELGEVIEDLLSKTKVSISKEAKKCLINYSAFDLSKITNELSKLVAFVLEGEISKKMVDEMVYKDSEYQIFELTEAISNGNNNLAVDILTNLAFKEKSAFSLITPLYNNYKRALYISINKTMSNVELAKYLQIKEFAVLMLRKQIKVFSPKKLKLIVDNLADLDKNIKQGKIKEDIGLISSVLNILMIRNKNA